MRLLSNIQSRFLVASVALSLITIATTSSADEPGPTTETTTQVSVTEKTVTSPRTEGAFDRVREDPPTGIITQKTVTKSKAVETGKASKPASSSFAGGGSGSASAVSNTTSSVSSERLASAIGHYARARALIISAVNEFDQARKLSDPNPLLDGETWRNSVIDRAEDLERVLDPQPRTTRTGVRFDADPRLLGQGKSNP